MAGFRHMRETALCPQVKTLDGSLQAQVAEVNSLTAERDALRAARKDAEATTSVVSKGVLRDLIISRSSSALVLPCLLHRANGTIQMINDVLHMSIGR